MNHLLGHLAQFASFWKQGEFLCTQSLAYLLTYQECSLRFTDLIRSESGLSSLNVQEWRPESVQTDGGRPDIEGRNIAGNPVVKIEAKLGSSFGDGQLESYTTALQEGNAQSALLILVPASRLNESISYICSHFAVEGHGPWNLKFAPSVHVAVVTWERLIEDLEGVANEKFVSELLQFRAMYRVFNGDDIEPLTNDGQVLAWREREDWWLKLVDLTTRYLSGDQVMPFGLEKGSNPYHRRYVCQKFDDSTSCYSIGTRDPYDGFTTPIWLRFHKNTRNYARIRANLTHEPNVLRMVYGGWHLWLPLEVPRDSTKEKMIGGLVDQVNAIVAIAYQGL